VTALDRDDDFFDALLSSDVEALRDLLTDDFLIVDVMAGQVASRDDILGAIGNGDLRFVEVARDRNDVAVRIRDDAAVLVGRTRMRMNFLGSEASVSSRYTHVFVHEGDRWRLMSAQGTPIAEQE
jgi:ketosteroid isomerase-like protein